MRRPLPQIPAIMAALMTMLPSALAAATQEISKTVTPTAQPTTQPTPTERQMTTGDQLGLGLGFASVFIILGLTLVVIPAYLDARKERAEAERLRHQQLTGPRATEKTGLLSPTSPCSQASLRLFDTPPGTPTRTNTGGASTMPLNDSARFV